MPEREPFSAATDREQLIEALRNADWLITCLDNVRRGVVVRGLDEAWAAYNATLPTEVRDV